MKDPMAKMIGQEIPILYKKNIQGPMQFHRNEMAENFKTRMDYMDMQGYQTKKVHFEESNSSRTDQSRSTQTEFVDLYKKNINFAKTEFEQKERKMLEKLKTFGKRIDNINYSLGAMAQRHDERWQMI